MHVMEGGENAGQRCTAWGKGTGENKGVVIALYEATRPGLSLTRMETRMLPTSFGLCDLARSIGLWILALPLVHFLQVLNFFLDACMCGCTVYALARHPYICVFASTYFFLPHV